MPRVKRVVIGDLSGQDGYIIGKGNGHGGKNGKGNRLCKGWSFLCLTVSKTGQECARMEKGAQRKITEISR